MPTCRTCKQDKNETQFGKDKTKKSGIDTRCFECSRIYSKIWYTKKSKDKIWKENRKIKRRGWQRTYDERRKKEGKTRRTTPEKELRNRLKTCYKITLEEYELMLKGQNGICAGCFRSPGKYRLAIDHNHSCCPGRRTCGKCIRALLCSKCNSAIELGPEVLYRLIDIYPIGEK